MQNPLESWVQSICPNSKKELKSDNFYFLFHLKHNACRHQRLKLEENIPKRTNDERVINAVQEC